MSTEDQGGNGWADNVDYGDEEEDDTNMNNMDKNNNDWADDVDYGDDDDNDDINNDSENEIGDLGLTDDDDDDDNLPQTNGIGPTTNFKSEITSTLYNPYNIGISYKLEFDTNETPGDISDDDETAPGLKINHFQLITTKELNNTEYKTNNSSDDTLLGSGSFAKVFRARNIKSKKNQIVALKCMYKNLLRKQFLMKSKYDLKNNDDTPIIIRHTMLDAVQIELQIMMKIKHINIIRLYYIIDDPTKDSLYLSIEFSPYGQIMEFDGKKLKYIPNQNIIPKNKYIIKYNNILKPWWYKQYVSKDNDNDNGIWDIVETYNEKTIRKLFMDCVKGIKYLHDLNIIHRDIKPENLLLFSDNNNSECGLIVKIADFGTAQEFNHKNEAILIDTQGTYHFMSPSAISGEKRNAFYDDIWALGIVLYSFIFGTIPYFHPLDYQLFESIQNDKLILPNENNMKNISNEIKDLIQKILIKKDEERITLNDIEKHEWYINNNYIHPEYKIEQEEEEHDDDNNINMYENQNRSSKDDCCIVV